MFLEQMLLRYVREIRTAPDFWSAQYLAAVSSSLGRGLSLPGTCSRGHLLAYENVYPRHRSCRACAVTRRLLKDQEHPKFQEYSDRHLARLLRRDHLAESRIS